MENAHSGDFNRISSIRQKNEEKTAEEVGKISIKSFSGYGKIYVGE